MFRRTIALAASFAVLASMLSAIPASAAEKNTIIDYTTFDSESELGSWSLKGGTNGSMTIEQDTGGGYLRLVQDSSKNTTVCVRPFPGSDVLDMSVLPVRFVVKSELRFISGGSSTSDVAELWLSNNEGERIKLVRIAGNNKVSVHRSVRNLSSGTADTSNYKITNDKYTPGDWVQAICVITVGDDGNGVFEYFIDGEKYTTGDAGKEFSLENITTLTAKHFSFAVKSASAGTVTTADFDNAGMYSVTEIPELTAELSNSGAIATDTPVVLSFSNEIYKAAFADTLTVNGLSVEPDRLITGSTQKTLEILPPDGGWEAGNQYTVDISGASDIFANTPDQTEFTFDVSDGGGQSEFVLIKTESASASSMPVAGGWVELKFSSDVSASEFVGKIHLNGTDIDEASISRTGKGVIHVMLPELEEDEEYTLICDPDITDINNTEYTGAEITYTFRSAKPFTGAEIFSDYSRLVPGAEPPTSNGNNYYGAVNVVADESGSMLQIGPATGSDVVNMLPVGTVTDIGRFVYRTKIKLLSGSGQVRLRFQQGEKNNTNSNNVIYFRNNKFSLRERNYGSGYDASKIIEVGSFRNDVWYDFTVLFDMTKATPTMNVFLSAEDGAENYSVYDVDISPSMLTLGGKDWSTMTNIGTYLQSGSSNNLVAYQKYQTVYAVNDNSVSANIPYDAVNVSVDAVPMYKFNMPVIAEGMNINISCNGVKQTAAVGVSYNGRELTVLPGSGISAGAQYEITGSVKDVTGNTISLPAMLFTAKAEELWAHDASRSVNGNEISVKAFVDNKLDTDEQVEFIAALYELVGGKSRWLRQEVKEYTISASADSAETQTAIVLTDAEMAAQGRYEVRVFMLHKPDYVLVMNPITVYESGNEAAASAKDTVVPISGNVISGKGGKRVMLYVFGAGTQTGVCPEFDNSNTVYSGTAVSGDEGAYDVSFIMNSGFASGKYPYMVTANDGTVEYGSFEYVNAQWQSDFIKSINAAKDAAELKSIAAADIARAGISNSRFSQIGIDGIYAYLYKHIPFDEEDPSGFIRACDEAIFLALLNGGTLPLTGGFITSEGFDFYDHVDKDIAAMYKGSLNTTGVSKVNSLMCKQGLADIDAAAELFEISTLLCAISNSSSIGSSHITEILTSYHDVLGIDIGKYTAQYRNYINNSLISANAYSKKDFIQAYNDAVLRAINSSSSGGGGGGGGSSSGGKSGSGAGAALVGTSSLMPIIEPTPQPGMYTDTGSVPWAEEAIEAISELGIVDGDGEGRFRPDDNITREEFVKIIVKLFGLGSSQTQKPQFMDVPEDAWYYESVCAAFDNGVITGISDELFGAGMNITRQDIAVICQRAIEKAGKNKPNDNEYKDFSDKDSISDYALDAVIALMKNGIINGYDDGSFIPLGYATRAETAVIIYNIHNSLF